MALLKSTVVSGDLAITGKVTNKGGNVVPIIINNSNTVISNLSTIIISYDNGVLNISYTTE